jgi:hypothetical protein
LVIWENDFKSNKKKCLEKIKEFVRVSPAW